LDGLILTVMGAAEHHTPRGVVGVGTTWSEHQYSSLLSGESGGSNYSIGRYPESNDIDTFSQLTAQDGEGRG
jgi:hypothetical protein